MQQLMGQREGGQALAGEVGAGAIRELAARLLEPGEPLEGVRHEVGCTEVEGFTAEGLVALCELIKRLRAGGGDLVLCGLRPEARSGVLERLAQAWLPAQLAKELVEFARTAPAFSTQGPWQYIAQK
jgi:hypothetical protein